MSEVTAQTFNENLENTNNANLLHGKFIENIDPDDPDYRRELQRPADVKEDMRQMESRQRVSSILNSQAFREELESIIADQLKHGPHPSSLIALQQISELLLPNTNSRWQQISSMGKSGNVLIPINDIRGIDTLNYAKGERLLRCKLASLFRIIDLYGWASGISNYISVRVNQELEQFLINPFGLLYHEVSASSLIKINSNGSVAEQGSTTYGVNKSAFNLHSAIYKARPDIKCIIHIHTNSTTAISSMKCGLLPISQEAILCGNISYHDYKGIMVEDDIKRLLAQDLGPINKVIFLKNHGVVVCGETIEEACYYLFNTIAACEIQTRALVGGLDNLIIPTIDAQQKLSEISLDQNESLTLLENKKWKVGELEFEAMMRCLDNAGYRTGYMYRQPIVRNIDRNAIKEVEIPPASTSCSYDTEYIKKLKEEKQKLIKGEWLNSPNVYARTETEETGTPNPKKITKWVPESSPNKTSTPIRIENKHQFAPQGSDPKELKNQQKQVKQKYYDDKVDAGPESKILIGVGQSISDESKANTNTNEQFSSQQTSGVVYGAASKGIIKRDQQNNAVVYKSYYAASNPFQQMDQNELEKYKKEIAQKQIREQENAESKSDASQKINKSEIVSSESGSKKKSHTIPRSKSLLDKKHEKVSGNLKSNSGGSNDSSPQSSRDSSPVNEKGQTQKEKSSSMAGIERPTNTATNTPSVGKTNDSNASNTNKSATIPSTAYQNEKEKEKPKKKSKLSFLSRKKNKDQSSQ